MEASDSCGGTCPPFAAMSLRAARRLDSSRVYSLQRCVLYQQLYGLQTLTGMALGSVASKCIDHAGKLSTYWSDGTWLVQFLLPIVVSCISLLLSLPGSSSADPSSRWKRLLVGVLVLGAVGAAGTSHTCQCLIQVAGRHLHLMH